MCSVARNFSRFSSCRMVLLLVCSTISSAEQLTSGATPGTEVSTLGGAHGVTEAAETARKRAVLRFPSGTNAAVAPSRGALARRARWSLATDAEADLGHQADTHPHSTF